MARHLIYRQKIMLNLSGKQEAFALQEKVSRLVKNELSHSLEDALDSAFPPDRVVRIDTLRLDLGTISLQNFENEFKTGFKEALAKSLSAKSEVFQQGSKSADKKEEVLSKPQSLKEALFFFLQKGYLPWYSPEWNINDWEAEIFNNFSDGEYQQLIKWLKDNYPERPVVIDRLVFQFSDKFIEALLLKIRPGFDVQWQLIFGDYSFILGSLLKTTTRPARNKKEQTGDVWENPDFKYIADESGDVRDKIWQFALRVWLDAGVNEPVDKILGLLLAYFGISTKHSDRLKQNKVAAGIRTEAVKKAFENIFLKRDNSSARQKSGRNKPADGDAADILENGTGTGKTDNDLDGGRGEYDHADNKTTAAQNKKGKAGKEGKAKNKNTDDLSTPAAGNDNQLPDADSDEQAAAQAFLKKSAKKDMPSAAKKMETNQGDLITANNCGLVLLNPFFKKYFEDLGLTQDNAFISEAARGRAVLLLNYLATGKNEAAEFDLALQKILCGYPADETLVTSIKLTKKEKADSESLLKAVVNYWEPMRNTSIVGFRETFLQRAGNLEMRESGWMLKVEHKTLDILLGKLPWGFSTIRLPWMKDLLSVDWY